MATATRSSRQADVILVWKLDRAFSPVLDATNTVDQLRRWGCGLRPIPNRGSIPAGPRLWPTCGDRDQVERAPALRETFARFPSRAPFHMLEGIGHLSPPEAPDALAKCPHRPAWAPL